MRIQTANNRYGQIQGFLRCFRSIATSGLRIDLK